ncbi:MAG: alpha-amylase [Polyangiaceae bacterium]|nr:alpha-amylase [Polyangiaceae bacterium]
MLRIYQVNTATWLHSLSAQANLPITLADIPDSAVDLISQLGVNCVWLMGVWERSPAGRQIALTHPDLQKEYTRALPNVQPSDVAGSPYCIRGYSVDPMFGTAADLASFRKRLANRGMKLILDFVPNHVAVDHPWVETHPEYLLQALPEVAQADTSTFFQAPGGAFFAHGKDPYFPAWTDTLQVNAFHPQLRRATISTLLSIAAQCDGVRCDMAMLLTSAVFSKTWGKIASNPPAVDYWEEIIPSVKSAFPNFTFMAEVYWDLEWQLIQQGFNFAYDKRLYDRLLHESAGSIRAHLQADLTYQSHLVRFLENHDEPRAMVTFGPERVRAAAILISTLPGALILHEGQELGHRIKLPVQLHRRPVESSDLNLRDFYQNLLTKWAAPTYPPSTYHSIPATPHPFQPNGHQELIAHSYHHQNRARLVVVNWSNRHVQGYLPLGHLPLSGDTVTLLDQLTGIVYTRNVPDLRSPGLHVILAPWQAHVFEIAAA